ncbi:MAG: hypothetical protein EA349_05270 [Halomonadaceae bacterium]|nr:MAG: hypothetical protein EA349_05270 [Halomonadaceae bacterium]
MKQSVLRVFLSLGLVLGLSGCLGDDKASPASDATWQARTQSLIYSYPAAEQIQVPLSAPVVLRFSSAVTHEPLEQAIVLRGPGGEPKDYQVSTVDQGRGLLLTPLEPLTPRSDYRVEIRELQLAQGPAADVDLPFTSAALDQGPLSWVQAGDGLVLERMLPDGDRLPVMDFSSLRLQFSGPLERGSVVYGETVQLTGPEGLVAARLLVKGARLTIDPKQDLTPGVEYTLSLSPGIRDWQGQSLSQVQSRFTPGDSGSRSTLVQTLTDSQNGQLLSLLTGQPVNEIALESILLGDDNRSSQRGNVYAELAHLPSFPEVSPLRIARGSLLQGAALELAVGGEVPLGFDSGDISIHFISDASGYLLENPYSDRRDAPRQLVLFMDIALSSEDPRASSAMTQSILHLQLNGIARLQDERMVIDAVGVVEPRILGLENARSLLSFSMASLADQRDPPAPLRPDGGPVLSSWQPADRTSLANPGDPLIFNFSHPLEEALLGQNGNILLSSLSGLLPFSVALDGSAVVITPESPLPTGEPLFVTLFETIEDIYGNPIQRLNESFTLPAEQTEDPQAPVVVSSYPGFPCTTVEYDLAANNAGRCQGGREDDDHLPLTSLPRERPIEVSFSRSMDPDSITPTTVVVEQLDTQGNAMTTVPGQLYTEDRTLRFYPEQPWQEGAYYRYHLSSVVENPACGSNALCDRRGLPLQTQLLAQHPDQAVSPEQGGDGLTVLFQGGAAGDGVRQPLLNLPTADRNANFRQDDGEPRPSANPEAMLNSARLVPNPEGNPEGDGTAASGLMPDTINAVKDANVGCGFDEQDQRLECDPDDQTMFVTGRLDAEVMGFIPPDELDAEDDSIPQQVRDQGGVLVYINPTHLIMSGVVVHPIVSDLVASINMDAEPVHIGPQVMRMRYACNAAVAGDCDGPDQGRLRAWIFEEDGAPSLSTTMNLYLDAPRLDPIVRNFNFDPPETLPVTHNLYSYPLTLSLGGSMQVLEDGRLEVSQVSLNAMTINVELIILNGLQDGVIYLSVPAGETVINFVSPPVKP